MPIVAREDRQASESAPPGKVGEAAQEAKCLSLGDGGEEAGVDVFDDRDRSRGEGCSAFGYSYPAGAGNGGIDVAFDQALALEATEHLGGHLDVRSCLCCDRHLVRMCALLVQPPGAGEQHELDVREIERRQRLGDVTLPAQRRVPEQEPWARARLKRSGVLGHRRILRPSAC